MSTRPRNVLLIQSDQHRADCLGIAGGRVRTPQLDRLAREGVYFPRAFTPIGVCAPVRSCLLTGRWPIHHGAITNWNMGESRQRPDQRIPRWSDSFARAGYRMGYVGKWHVSDQFGPRDCGFNDFIPEEYYDDWRASQGLPPRPKTGWEGGVDEAISPNQTRLAWGADQTINLLHEYSASGKPFFLRWDPSEPHLPSVVPEPFASMYNPETITPWPSFDDPLKNKPSVQKRQRQRWKVEGWKWERWAPIVGRYLGEIEMMDAQIGRVLGVLDGLGLSRDTLVVYTSDHGDLCGSHGMFDKHYVMYDDVMRVPLIARWPAGWDPQEFEGFVTHALDLAATFWAVLGEKPNLPGVSLFDQVAGRVPAKRAAFGMYHGGQSGLFSQRMVRTRDWKLVYNPVAEDELYGVSADPGEIHNRIGDPLLREIEPTLRSMLRDWMASIRDPLLNQWTEIDLPGHTNPEPFAGRKWRKGKGELN